MNEKFDLFKYYREQRDKHLQQLMDINGRVTFSVLGGLAALMVTVITLNADIRTINFSLGWAWVAFAGLLCLVAAIIMYSRFHTGKVRHFESRMMKFDFKNEDIRLEPEDTNILPHWFSNYLIGG